MRAAVFMSAALISKALQVGRACRIKAAAPVTWGADIEVPVMGMDSVPYPARVEGMALPGAARSGLRRLV